jgi:hypothetical protein
MKQDIATDQKLEKICPDLAARWVLVRKRLFDSIGMQIRVTEALRSFAMQFEVWAKGRTRLATGSWVISDPSKVISYAVPGASFHQFGLAIDSCFQGKDPYLEKMDMKEAREKWELFGKYCHEEGLDWGGYWKRPDKPHCEKRYGLSIHSIQIIHENSGLKAVWKECMSTL